MTNKLPPQLFFKHCGVSNVNELLAFFLTQNLGNNEIRSLSNAFSKNIASLNPHLRYEVFSPLFSLPLFCLLLLCSENTFVHGEGEGVLMKGLSFILLEKMSLSMAEMKKLWSEKAVQEKNADTSTRLTKADASSRSGAIAKETNREVVIHDVNENDSLLKPSKRHRVEPKTLEGKKPIKEIEAQSEEHTINFQIAENWDPKNKGTTKGKSMLRIFKGVKGLSNWMAVTALVRKDKVQDLLKEHVDYSKEVAKLKGGQVTQEREEGFEQSDG
ncbi:hypothetical protein VNO78_00495 [Psophocarpus tetragonolobus]|uniref:Uncharacterized protein n=1 Tax=Psophocarpus tetragonolobus TaxID=3891 RepID=A0AAN9XU61_PSOTE